MLRGDPPIRLTAIIARHVSGIIGINGRLPWHIPEDLKYFRDTTENGILICGGGTYEDIKRIKLGTRRILVVSRRLFDSPPPNVPPGLVIVPSMVEVMEWVPHLLRQGLSEVFVIGGARLLAGMEKDIDRILLTTVTGPLSYAKTDVPTRWSIPRGFTRQTFGVPQQSGDFRYSHSVLVRR